MSNISGKGSALSVREALTVALEGLPGGFESWVDDGKQRKTLRVYLLDWIKDYAKVRGVIFEDKDVTDEIDGFIVSIRKHVKT